MQKHKKDFSFAKKLNRVMAYIYVPLLFSVLAYGTIYVMASDFIGIVRNSLSLIMSEDEPDFSDSHDSVFVQGQAEVMVDNGVETVKRSEVQIAEYGELYAYIRCTKLAMEAPVYKGDSDDILKLGIGQNFASSQPGFGRLILLCGHNNTYFNALKNVEVGDVFEIETSYGKYEYEVYETKVLNEDDNSAYDFSIEEEKLVLYTCYPFDTLSRTPYRFFVYAERISGPEFVD
jgi:sortase A